MPTGRSDVYSYEAHRAPPRNAALSLGEDRPSPTHDAWKEMVNSTATIWSRQHGMGEENENPHLPGLLAGPRAMLVVNPDPSPPRPHSQQTPAFPDLQEVQGSWEESGISGPQVLSDIHWTQAFMLWYVEGQYREKNFVIYCGKTTEDENRAQWCLSG